MATQGPNLPGTAASSGTDTPWINPDNAKLDDGIYTTCALVGGLSSSQLRLSNFSFTIPAGATINGVEVKIERLATGDGTVTDSAIQLIDTVGGNLGSPKTSGDYPGSDTITTYGSSSDLWGQVWPLGGSFGATFGVDITCNATSGTATTAKIDYVTITIYYTAGAGSSSHSVAVIVS